MNESREQATLTDALKRIKERIKEANYLTLEEQETLSQEYTKILVNLYRLSHISNEKRFEEKFSEFKEAILTTQETALTAIIKQIENSLVVQLGGKLDLIRIENFEFVTRLERIENALISLNAHTRSHTTNNQNIINEIFTESKTIDCEFYIDSEDAIKIDAIFTSLKNVLNVFDFQLVDEKAAIKGSWIKKAKAKIVSFFENDRVQEKLKELELAINKQTLEKPQSEIDLNQAKAIAELFKSLEHVPNAALRIGSLLVIKVTESGEGKVLAVTLTPTHLDLLSKCPELLYKPQDLLLTLTSESDLALKP